MGRGNSQRGPDIPRSLNPPRLRLRSRHISTNFRPLLILPSMPAMAFRGVVTKSGVMNKTATVTVSRWIRHQLTGKVRAARSSAETTNSQTPVDGGEEEEVVGT